MLDIHAAWSGVVVLSAQRHEMKRGKNQLARRVEVVGHEADAAHCARLPHALPAGLPALATLDPLYDR